MADVCFFGARGGNRLRLREASDFNRELSLVLPAAKRSNLSAFFDRGKASSRERDCVVRSPRQGNAGMSYSDDAAIRHKQWLM